MAALDSASSSSVASAIESSSTYDVFINFRGEDLRNNFIGFLYKILNYKGIHAFLDSEKLRTGEEIGPALYEAIRGSKIAIPVFSKGYADSKWCLDELVEIVQCHESNKQIILPIFFNVDPKDVRHQTGTFEKAFLEYQKKFDRKKVNSWRKALRVVGKLKGDVIDDTKNQAKVVESVVKRALRELVNSTRLPEGEFCVDMDSRVKDLSSLLNIGSNDVQFVGICGLGGIGKTTLAKAVYNDIRSTFGDCCFLSNVREKATQFEGLVSLQKRFLMDIFNEDFDIRDLPRGKKIIEERVGWKKVLLVLDDVDTKDQIDALAGNPNWFGKGSRVIITTRDEGVLNLAKVNGKKIYKPELLDHVHSLQLFSWHAFQNSQPPKDYMQLSRAVVYHSGGLPLVLEVFGSYLSDFTEKHVWKCTLKMLKDIPGEKVQRRLKISYDNLEDNYQRDIFLDAACFFIGWKKEILISIWEACGFHPEPAISKLIERSLLKFDGECLTMHDHIRDMGREIVLDESREDPSKRSRLWSYGNVVEVLGGHKETETIKGMSCLYDLEPPFNLSTKSLKLMPNLRFLDVTSSFESVMETSFQLSNFYHKGLVYLKLSHNSSNQLWNVRPLDKHKGFQKLKILDHSNCYHLPKSPNFSWFPSLEQLYFGGCHSLKELDESIGQLSRLKGLFLNKCESLKKLPESIGYLKSLVKLDLSFTKVEELPDSIYGMTSLKELILLWCRPLKELPESIGYLKSLVKLDLSCTKIKELPDSIYGMTSLEELILKRCLPLKKLPESIGDLESLVKLDLTLTNIKELPDSISRMISLKELILRECHSFKKLPEPIGDLKSLVKLDLWCTKIEELPNSISRMTSLKELILESCKSLKKFPESIGDLKSLVKLDLSFTKIEELPDNISRMTSLRELILRYCYSLKKLPESIGDLKSLVKLDLSLTKIKKLPNSISRMTSLEVLILQHCSSLKKLPDGVELLEKLEVLDFQDCSTLAKLPRSFGGMRCLESIELVEIPITEFHDDFSMPPNLVELEITLLKQLNSLPANLSALKTLKQLRICQCQMLEYIPALPSCLVELCIQRCGSLARLPGLSKLKLLRTLTLTNCEKLEEIPGLEEIESLSELNARGSFNLTFTQKKKKTQVPAAISQIPRPLSLENVSLATSRIILSLVLKISPDPTRLSLESGWRPIQIQTDVYASIHKKNKKVSCLHSLSVKNSNVEYSIGGEVSYICHFRGFDWFGVPLHEDDKIEIFRITAPGSLVKFCEILYTNGELGTQMPRQNSNTLMMVPEFSEEEEEEEEEDDEFFSEEEDFSKLEENFPEPDLSKEDFPKVYVLSRLRLLDSVSDAMAEEEAEMLGPGKRVRFHNDDSPDLNGVLKDPN